VPEIPGPRRRELEPLSRAAPAWSAASSQFRPRTRVFAGPRPWGWGWNWSRIGTA